MQPNSFKMCPDVAPSRNRSVEGSRNDSFQSNAIMLSGAYAHRYPTTRCWKVCLSQESCAPPVESQIGGKWVKFQGYMMDDWVHKAESKNTANPSTPTCKDDGNDPKPCVWRATTWEVHPVTAYTVVPGP